jgi:hypothetical protein
LPGEPPSGFAEFADAELAPCDFDFPVECRLVVVVASDLEVLPDVWELVLGVEEVVGPGLPVAAVVGWLVASPAGVAGRGAGSVAGAGAGVGGNVGVVVSPPVAAS